MKLKQIAEGIQRRTQRWRADFEEEIETIADLALDLGPGGREYIGTLHVPDNIEDQLTLPMLREFRKKMIALLHRSGGEEWLVDERYALIYDLLLKYNLATKA